MMEAKRSSETSVLTRVTQRHIPEDGILQPRKNSGKGSGICNAESNLFAKRQNDENNLNFKSVSISKI
jgi:hypothetical protein